MPKQTIEIVEGGKCHRGKNRTEQRGMRMHGRRGSSENLVRTGMGGKLIIEQRLEGVRVGPGRWLGGEHPCRGRHTLASQDGHGDQGGSSRIDGGCR